MSIASTLIEVRKEMERQVEKWGEQNHPSVLPLSQSEAARNLSFEAPPSWYYNLPSEKSVKFACDEAAKSGRLTYAHIAVEELVEAIDADTDEDRRAELIQAAAVLLSWVGAIDRRSGRQ